MPEQACFGGLALPACLLTCLLACAWPAPGLSPESGEHLWQIETRVKVFFGGVGAGAGQATPLQKGPTPTKYCYHPASKHGLAAVRPPHQ